jgi:hypothetical protein
VASGLTQDFFNRRLLQIRCVIAKDFGAQRRAHAVALVAAGGRVMKPPNTYIWPCAKFNTFISAKISVRP